MVDLENTSKIEILKGLETAFVDKHVDSKNIYQPKLISNDYKKGIKVLPYIEKELSTCEEFFISVAFITNSGIEPLMQVLKELNARGVKGKVLTTDYLQFSEPVALNRLHQLSNIEIRMYMTHGEEEGFHTKGYIFKENGLYKIIVGSSNLTQSALTKNVEWNNRFISSEQGAYTEEILSQFETLWNSEKTLSFNDFISRYTYSYNQFKAQRDIEKKIRQAAIQESYEIYRVEPNSMQKSFLERLRELRDSGETRALLISATGTGKTYASAFAIRDMNPHKVLFLVHREQIANKSIESYKRIFGKGVTFGLLSGHSKDYDAQFVFATRDTMANSETLKHYSPDEFDVICIDEVHKAGAPTYQKIRGFIKKCGQIQEACKVNPPVYQNISKRSYRSCSVYFGNHMPAVL